MAQISKPREETSEEAFQRTYTTTRTSHHEILAQEIFIRADINDYYSVNERRIMAYDGGVVAFMALVIWKSNRQFYNVVIVVRF